MAYQPLPHDSVAPPPSGILPNTFPDSHAVWTVDVDAGSGQRHGDAVMEGGTPPDPPEPEYEPLVVGDPTVTGQAIVGYTLSCSQPSIEGGSGDVTINYYWQDADNKRVLYMGETQVVKEVDIGRTICCQVHVVDNQTSENFTVVSNSVGPVNRPVLPEFDVWVDGELHEDPTADVGIEPNGTVVIEVRQMPVSNAPADLTYEWKIRNGTGRLSGDLDGTGIIYLAPDTAPAGALVTCLANSLDANDSAYAAEVPILVSE